MDIQIVIDTDDVAALRETCERLRILARCFDEDGGIFVPDASVDVYYLLETEMVLRQMLFQVDEFVCDVMELYEESKKSTEPPL